MWHIYEFKNILDKKCFRYITDEVEDCCYEYVKIGNFCEGRTINLIFKHLILFEIERRNGNNIVKIHIYIDNNCCRYILKCIL